MNALVFTQTQHCQYQPVASPTPKPGEALIQVEAAGICGSDMHAWHGHDERRQPPLILGHEVAGRVVAGKFQGQRVTLNPIIACGNCNYCKQQRDNLCTKRSMIGMDLAGGFADYVCIAEQCLIPINEDTPAEFAALSEPTAVCLHAINLLKKLSFEELQQQSILIIGAGAIGLIAALLLQYYGVQKLTLSETNPLRLQTSGKLFNTQNPLRQPLPSNHFHSVIDAVGTTATRQQAITSVQAGGNIIHLGLQQANGDMDARKLTLAEISFSGSFTYTMAEIVEAAQLLQTATFQRHLQLPVWLKNLPLAEGQNAFQAIHASSEAAAKIILIPSIEP